MSRNAFKIAGNHAGQFAGVVQQGALLNFLILTNSEDGATLAITTDSEDGTIQNILINTEDR